MIGGIPPFLLRNDKQKNIGLQPCGDIYARGRARRRQKKAKPACKRRLFVIKCADKWKMQ
jgi:hypothetical protein